MSHANENENCMASTHDDEYDQHTHTHIKQENSWRI